MPMAEADPDDDATSTAAWSDATPMHPSDAHPRGETAEQALQAVVDLHGPAMFYEADALRAELEARCPRARGDIALLLIGLEEQIPQALLAVHADDDVAPLALRLERRLRMRRSLEPDEAAWVVGTWARVLRLWSVAAASQALRPIGRRTEVPAAASAPLASPPTSAPVEVLPVTAHVSPPDADLSDQEIPNAAPVVNRWYGIGGLIAAVAVVLAIVRYEATTAPGGRPAMPAAVEEQPTPPVAAAPPSLPPEPRITDVVSSEPLVADGRQREVFVSMASPHGAIDSVEARFVDGDTPMRSAPTVVDVSSDPLANGRVPAGLIGIRSTKPLKATFEYVVTMADGTRTAPFTKELSLAPIAATPPTIASVVLPDGIVAGKSFNAAIAFRTGDAPIAAIESSVVVDDIVEAPRVTPVATTATPDADGMLRVPIVADRSPTTMQFALVDADGGKSAAKRVAFDVAPAPRPVARCQGADCDVPHVAPVRSTAIGEKTADGSDRPVDASVGSRAAAVPSQTAKDRPVAAKAGPARPAPREGRLVPESPPSFDPGQ